MGGVCEGEGAWGREEREGSEHGSHVAIVNTGMKAVNVRMFSVLENGSA